VHDNLKTTALVAGIGYRLGPSAGDASGAEHTWPVNKRRCSRNALITSAVYSVDRVEGKQCEPTISKGYSIN
jgi:hypothetical protein